MDQKEDRAEGNKMPAIHNAVLDHGDKTVPRSSVEAVSSAEKLDRLVLYIARLVGRQMARDDYERRSVFSDDRDTDG